VDRQEVDVLQAEPVELLVELADEFSGVGSRAVLGLHNDLVPRKSRQDPAELPFRRAVAAGGLEVVDAQLERPSDRGFEVLLALRRHLVHRHVLPLVLEAHAAATEHGHGDLGAAESSVEHACLSARQEESLWGED
jgi:hypothetical protein